MNAQLQEIIKNFDPITLTEMDSVKLMDRTDTKYVFSTDHLPVILKEMSAHYRLLEINEVRIHRYESLYFDTPDFQLYSKHQIGKQNRYKLRFRSYVDSGGLSFFEIKFKNNKGRTIKERVKVGEINSVISGNAEEFLKKVTPFDATMFEPKLWVNYSRMTFVNKFSQERLTLDTNLRIIKTDGSNFSVDFPKMVIAEAKQDKTNHASPFIRLVRKQNIREGGISKYCFAVFTLNDQVKKNNFKPVVRFIHKCVNQQVFSLTV
ncbi:MAG: polyphosphate polymerase domain-containing protein [Bacteroidetes bacterium]|nr:polyphosphate polymerase domain-containing protein [Bacteroidota bacterium]